MSREEESPRNTSGFSAGKERGEKRGAQNLTFTPSLGIVLSVSVIGAVVARFVHTEEVTGSNPVSRTKEPPFQGTGVLLCPPGQTHRQQSTAADTTTRE